MFKKLLLALATIIATMGFAFADVDVNKADQAALDGIKGIGPKMSKTIIDERKKGGDFKDWADFEKRVKGVGEKNSVKFSESGLTVGGQAKAAKADAKDAKKDAKADAKDAKKDAKADAKEMKKDAKADTKEVKKNAKADATEMKKDAKADATEMKKDAKADATEMKKDAKADAKKAKKDAKADAKDAKKDEVTK